MSAYLLAKIRGKLSRMVEDADLDRLVGTDLDAVSQRLRTSSYAEALGETWGRASDRLRQAFLDDVADLIHSLYGRERTLLMDMLARYRIENLKTIIRAQLHHIPADEVKGHLFSIAWEDVDYLHLLELPGLEAVIRALPWEEYRTRLDAVHRQVGDKRVVFPYEAELDAIYLQRLIHQYQSGPASAHRILKTRVLKELLSWAFRLKHYGRSFPELVNILPDFRPLIQPEELRHIVEDNEGWRGVAQFLGPMLGDELKRMDKFDLAAIENLFDRKLMEVTRESFVMTPFGMGVVVGYVYLKERELSRLIEIIEQVRRKAQGGANVHH